MAAFWSEPKKYSDIREEDINYIPPASHRPPNVTQMETPAFKPKKPKPKNVWSPDQIRPRLNRHERRKARALAQR